MFVCSHTFFFPLSCIVVDVCKDEQEKILWLERVNKSLNLFPHYKETEACRIKGWYMHAISGWIKEMKIFISLSN
jgi:hypothetical protein